MASTEPVSVSGVAFRSNAWRPRSSSVVSQKKLFSRSQLLRGRRVAVYLEMGIPERESGSCTMKTSPAATVSGAARRETEVLAKGS